MTLGRVGSPLYWGRKPQNPEKTTQDINPVHLTTDGNQTHMLFATQIFWFFNYLIFGVPGDGYSRNTKSALN